MNFRAENNEWHHGFQMDFANGCTISVQFSKGITVMKVKQPPK
jgi:hypothetical protein